MPEVEPTIVKVAPPDNWFEFFKQMARQHGLPLVALITLVGVVMWKADRMQTNYEKSAQEANLYQRETLFAIANKSIETTTIATEAIREATDQDEKVEDALRNGNRILARIEANMGRDGEIE